MKKYDWNDERKKATPAPVMPKVSATEKVTEDQTKVPELVTEENQENQEKQGFFKEKTGKVLIMIGRFMFFLCPALSTSNTLFNFYCKTKQLSAAPQYVLPISSQQFAGKMSYDSYVSNELNKALSNVVQKIVKTSPFEVIYKEGYSNDDSSINTNMLDSKTFKVNSVDDIHKLLNQKNSSELSVSEFSITDSSKKNKSYIASQYVSGVKVFASAAIIFTDENGNVQYIKCKFSQAAKKMLSIKTKLLPTSIMNKFKKAMNGTGVVKSESIIFDPTLINKKGKACIAWKIEIEIKKQKKICLIVDQSDEKIIFQYDMTNRKE